MKTKQKIIIGLVLAILLVIIGALIFLTATCQAIAIVKLHNGKTSITLLSQKGNNHEPAQCTNFPFIIATE